MQSGVHRFACTQCGKCCNRSPEVELSEAAALADVFVFRLMFRVYELPRTFADYLASGRANQTSAEEFHQKKRLLSAFAARKSPTKKRQNGKAVEYVRYLTISALTVDTGSDACSALSGGRCGIYERRPFSCRTAPLHYSRSEASAERDLAAFVATPGYRCDTGPTAPILVEAGRIADERYRLARTEALALADRDRAWQQAIVRKMKAGSRNGGLPSLDEVQASAAVAATTTSMLVAWQIAAESELITAEVYQRLIAEQAATIDREIALAACGADARETLIDMRVEYRQLLGRA